MLFCFLKLNHPLVYYTVDRTDKWARTSCKTPGGGNTCSPSCLNTSSGCFLGRTLTRFLSTSLCCLDRGWQPLSNNCDYITNHSSFKLKNKIPIITHNIMLYFKTKPLMASFRIIQCIKESLFTTLAGTYYFYVAQRKPESESHH